MSKDPFDKVVEESYDKLADELGIDDEGDEILDEEPEEEIEDREEVVAEEPEEEIEKEIEEEVPKVVSEQVEDEPIAPHTWPQEYKDTFNKLPAEAKQHMLAMNRDMSAGFAKRMAQVNQERRKLGGVFQSLEPHQGRLNRAGITPEVAVQRSLAWDAHIQQHGARAILDMAKAYGVDLNQAQESAQEYLTPTERALQQKLDQLQGGVQQTQQQWQQWQQYQQRQDYSRRLSNAHAMLDEFINAKDPDGKPSHPYIEHVAPTMAKLIENQIAPDMESAYRMAANSNPDVQAALERRRQAARVGESRRKVDRVRKASNAGVVTKSSSKGGKPVKDFEDQLSRMYDKVANN